MFPYWLDWQTNSFWALIALLVLFAIFLRLNLFSKIGSALDDRTKKIVDELEEAKQLREEAQQLLAEYKRRQNDVEAEAQNMIKAAKKEAKELNKKAMHELEEELERKKIAAKTRIEMATNNVIAELKSNAVDLAIDEAQRMIYGELTADKDRELRRQALNRFKDQYSENGQAN